jgi:hypothetical protein
MNLTSQYKRKNIERNDGILVGVVLELHEKRGDQNSETPRQF